MSDTKNRPHGKDEDLIAKQDNPEEHSDEPAESSAGVAVKSPAPPQVNSSSAEAEQRPHKWREWIRTNLTVLISTAALCVSFGSCYGSNRSANTAEQALQATRRAAVYLGLPDGKIAYFLPGKEGLQIALYFRNVGPTTAQRILVEYWTLTLVPNQPTIVTKFPPPNKRVFGPSISPGSPYVRYISYADATQEELDAGKKYLTIIGRIVYTDVFGNYCEIFSLVYPSAQRPEFGLTAYPGPDLCDRREDKLGVSMTVDEDGTDHETYTTYK